MKKKVLLDSIQINEKTQHRENINFGHISRIRDAFLSSELVEPIHVVRELHDSGEKYWLVDGYHRYEAAKRASCMHIDILILNPEKLGSLELAIELSLKANASNGNALPREYGDILKAAEAAANMIYKKKQNLSKGIAFNPYPKVTVDEIILAVDCNKRMADRVVSKFNESIKIIQKKNILYQYMEGVLPNDIALNHGCSINIVNNCIKAFTDSKNRGTVNISNNNQHQFSFSDEDDVDLFMSNSGRKITQYNDRKNSSAKNLSDISHLDVDAQKELISHGIDKLKPKPKFKHRMTELNTVVEEDLRLYLMQNHFFDASKKEVACEAGRVDIVSDDEIVEVKRILNRSSVFSAVGQIYIYSQFFPKKKLVIAGKLHEDLERISQYVLNQGIDIVTICPSTGEIVRHRGVANGI